jgi:hypothetical protein
MKRVALAVATCGLAVVVGVLLHHSSSHHEEPASQVTRKQVELRYQLCQPRHWRALILKP